MARPGLKSSLVQTVRQMARTQKDARARNVQVQSNGSTTTVDVLVRPVIDPPDLTGLAVVFFESPQPYGQRNTDQLPEVSQEASKVADLRRQLVETQENLQSTIEELETANEELKSTNEELQSTNEELQSSNEELQTSKEELQSVNEESATVNAELQSRINALSRANDDLKNLLDSTGIATIFLDVELNIRRFTPRVGQLIALEHTDIGRPLSHFATTVLGIDFTQIAEEVLDDLVIREFDVTTKDGLHYLLRVRPYRTTQNVIDGVVLTFEDRTALQRPTTRGIDDGTSIT
jgi:two-component system CheB/CheR fusion protein